MENSNAIMRTITLIILHCSGVPTWKQSSAADIDRWHRERGWKYGIGYHYVVRRDGTIETGRPLEQVGAHCIGHNEHSIGVCYEGGLDAQGQPADTRTKAQRKSMRTLLEKLHQQFPNAIIMGHRDLSPDLDGDGHVSPDEWLKQCPCFDALWDYGDLEPEGLLNGND